MSTTTFTITEILQDRDRVHDAASTNVKKQMCEKYGIQSNRTKEIEKQILAVGMELHKQRTKFDFEDRKVFDLYWNYPESAAKIREAFADESDTFAEYYLDCLRNEVEQDPWRCRWKKKPIQYIQQILRERRDANNPERASLILAIDIRIKDFHDAYVQKHVEFADWKFESMKKKYGEINTIRDVILKMGITDDEKVHRTYRIASSFRCETRDYDKDFYLERVRRDVEAEYLRCVTMIADRVLTAKMNKDALKIDRISSDDAKAFDIYVNDDQRKMHARSVWCAELSEIVTPHWRFIITTA